MLKREIQAMVEKNLHFFLQQKLGGYAKNQSDKSRITNARRDSPKISSLQWILSGPPVFFFHGRIMAEGHFEI